MKPKPLASASLSRAQDAGSRTTGRKISKAAERNAPLHLGAFDKQEALIRAQGGDYQQFLSNGPGVSFIRRCCEDAPITTIWLPKPGRG